MVDVPNSSFPYEGLRVAKRPKGEHLYRVFSMLNRAPLTFFYFSQLAAWTKFEFDLRIDSYEAVNRWFDGPESSLFIAFYVRFVERDHFFYIPDPKHLDATQAFEKYARGSNVVATPLTTPEPSHKSIEFWNRLKMLSLITQHRERMTKENLDNFCKSIFFKNITIKDLAGLPEYSDGEAVAYAFELIRQGRCSMCGVASELINLNSIIKLKEFGVT